MEEDNSKRLYDLAIKEKEDIISLGHERVEQLKSQGDLTCVHLSRDEVNDIVRALEDRFGDLESNVVDWEDEELVKLYERIQGHLLVMTSFKERSILQSQNHSCLICGDKIGHKGNLSYSWDAKAYCKICWTKESSKIINGKL